MGRRRIYGSLLLVALATTGAAAYWWVAGAPKADAPPVTFEYDARPRGTDPLQPAQPIEVVLGQGLLDDGDRTDDGSSLADVVHGWLASPAFASLLDEQIRRELSASEHCDAELSGRCLVSSHRKVTAARLLSPSTVGFEIVGDQIVAEVHLRDLSIDIEGGLETARVPISLRGQIKVADVVLWTSLTLRIADHQLAVDIGDSDVQLGRLEAELGGFSGRVAGSLVHRYERDIRQRAEAVLTQHVSAAVSHGLVQAVGGLRLAPREILLGRPLGANVALTIGLTGLRVRPEGIRASLGVQVQGEPPRTASPRATTDITGQAWASVDLGMLAQCLVALWRQGVLATAIPGGQIPGGAAWVDLQAAVSHKPSLRAGEGGRLALVLPGILLRANVPWLGGVVVVGQAQAIVSVAPRLRDGALVLVDPRVDALEISGFLPSTVLAMNPDVTEASIAALATQVLASVLPAIPVPSIELPGWLQQYGPSGLAATEGTVWVQDERIGITIPQIVVH